MAAAAAPDAPKKDPFSKEIYSLKSVYPAGVPTHAYQCFRTEEISQKAGARQYKVILARGDIDDKSYVFKINKVKAIGGDVEVYHLNPPKPPRRMRYHTNGLDGTQEFYWFDDDGLRTENAKLKQEVKTVQQQRTEAVVERYNSTALRPSRGDAKKRSAQQLKEMKAKVKALENTDAIDRAALSAVASGKVGEPLDDIDTAAAAAGAVGSPLDGGESADTGDTKEPSPKRSTQSRVKAPCFAFLKGGSCARGDECRYSHEPGLKSEDMRQFMCGFVRYGVCEKKGCLAIHEVPDGPRFVEWIKSIRNRPDHCAEFFRYGDCRWGNKCKWKHDRPPLVPVQHRPKAPVDAETLELERLNAEKPDVSRFANIPDAKSNGQRTLRRLVN